MVVQPGPANSDMKIPYNVEIEAEVARMRPTVSRSTGLAKTIMQKGTVRGARRRGRQRRAMGRQRQRVDRAGLSRVTVRGARRRERQRKRWEDNVREWTGLDFPDSQRAVEDNVREWTGLDFPESQRAVEDRQRWRQLVREWTGLDFPQSQRAVEDRQRWRQLVREWTGLDCTELQRGLWKTDRDGGRWSESGQDWTVQSYREGCGRQGAIEAAGQRVDRAGLSRVIERAVEDRER